MQNTLPNQPSSHDDARATWAITIICFLILVVDGYDTATIAFVAPSLSKLWNVPQAALTPAFVLTSVGAVLGYVLAGPLARRFGRRRPILCNMLIFGILSFATTRASSVGIMSLLRLITAVALGCVVPAAISCASDHAGRIGKSVVTIGVTTGLSVGTAFGGLLASRLLSHYSWQSVFVCAGFFPLVLLPFAAFALRADDRSRVTQVAQEQPASVATLCLTPYRNRTLIIWTIAFLAFLVTYQFIFWIPTLLTSYGFTANSAALGVFACSLGGIVGNLVMLPLVRWFKFRYVMAGFGCLAIACILATRFVGTDNVLLLWLIAGIGAGTATGCVGQAALAVLTYPDSLRTTGVGYAAAAGRFGAIIGPATGGALLSLGLPAAQIITLFCAPIVLVVVLLIVSARRERHASFVEPPSPILEP
jgi:MFS transporter, AAHS family, 4-hydroxybenzoate transporter